MFYKALEFTYRILYSHGIGSIAHTPQNDQVDGAESRIRNHPHTPNNTLVFAVRICIGDVVVGWLSVLYTRLL